MILIHSSLNEIIKPNLEKSIDNFFKEIDRICDQNKINDFQEWFSERTFLSLFINAQIRNDKTNTVSAIQEYLVEDLKTSSKGRCDAILTIDKTAFLVESKCQKYPRKIEDSHWDIKAWEVYDNYVFDQLKWYLDAETKFFKDDERYSEVYLQTIVFKIVEANKDLHIAEALKEMKITGPRLNNRSWYYACDYPKAIQLDKNIGIEIYGSISKA